MAAACGGDDRPRGGGAAGAVGGAVSMGPSAADDLNDNTG
eukprot:gene15196-4540_t